MKNGMSVVEYPAIIRREECVKALAAVLPAHRGAAHALYNLSMRFSTLGWKELFVHLWQEEAKSLAELESKISQFGGNPELEYSDTREEDPEDEPQDPYLLDKKMILECINEHLHRSDLYAEIRRRPLPFDLRMMLQRHHLQTKEIVDRLQPIYVAYSHNHVPIGEFATAPSSA